MLTQRPLHRGAVTVVEFLCTAGPETPPEVEHRAAWSLSYVRRGSFGCACRGRQFELVPGSLLAGRPGDEYVCTHEHRGGGDECLAFFFDPALVDELDGDHAPWGSGALAPFAELATLGELAQCTASGAGD